MYKIGPVVGYKATSSSAAGVDMRWFTGDIRTAVKDEDGESMTQVCKSFNGIISDLLTSIHVHLLHQPVTAYNTTLHFTHHCK